jgi:hypothetical protein
LTYTYIQARRIKWVGYVSRMKLMENLKYYWIENRTEKIRLIQSKTDTDVENSRPWWSQGNVLASRFKVCEFRCG